MTHARRSIVAIAIACLAAGAAQAQSSTAELRNLCQTSPGNVVRIDGPVLIHRGAPATAPEPVATGCTLLIGEFGKFEAKEIGMSFAGAFSIQTASKGFVALSDTSLTGRSVNITGGPDSVLLLSESNLQSTAGDVAIGMGPNSKMELVDFLPFAPYIVRSAGGISISGGEKFGVTMKGGNLQATTGISVSLNGADTLLLADSASMTTTRGTLTVAASGNKGTMILNQGSYNAGGSVSVTLAGAESGAGIKDADFRSGSGNVLVDVGGGNAGGKLEVSQSRFNAPGTLSLLASRGSDLGFIGVDNTDLNGAGGVRVETGNNGGTFMKNSRGSSSVLFHVLSGLGGKCEQGDNRVTSPNQRLCF